jgi:hypothetical protein
MLQRIHIQVLDNPIEEIYNNDYTSEVVETNKMLTDELSKEMSYFYPSIVYVEYIDLFMDGDEEFEDIKELLSIGAVHTPIVLINGEIKIYGGIPTTLIKKEIEDIISKGLVH